MEIIGAITADYWDRLIHYAHDLSKRTYQVDKLADLNLVDSTCEVRLRFAFVPNLVEQQLTCDDGVPAVEASPNDCGRRLL